MANDRQAIEISVHLGGVHIAGMRRPSRRRGELRGPVAPGAAADEGADEPLDGIQDKQGQHAEKDLVRRYSLKPEQSLASR